MHKMMMIAIAGAIALAPATGFGQIAAPPNNPPAAENDQPCEYGMGYLKRISVQQVGGIDDDWRVWVRPVCEDSPHAPVRNMGNATQLIGAIGRNDVLEAALDEKHYQADDVVGVQMTKGNRVTLWVHPSLY